MPQLKVRRKKETKKKKSQNLSYEEKAKKLKALFDSHVRTWFTDFINATCLKCGEAEEVMVRVSSIFFCPKCFFEEFDFEDKKRDDENFNKWLETYKLRYLPGYKEKKK